MSNIRKNIDIKYIIVHHTSLDSMYSGMDINNLFNRKGFFGVPYDALINFDGSIDLSARWVNGNTSNFYTLNVRLKDIFTKYKVHKLAGLEVEEYNTKGFHIAIVGNFDILNPSLLQYDSLRKLLQECSTRLGVSLNTALLYYSEIFDTTSPGSLFINKAKLI